MFQCFVFNVYCVQCYSVRCPASIMSHCAIMCHAHSAASAPSEQASTGTLQQQRSVQCTVYSVQCTLYNSEIVCSVRSHSCRLPHLTVVVFFTLQLSSSSLYSCRLPHLTVVVFLTLQLLSSSSPYSCCLPHQTVTVVFLTLQVLPSSSPYSCS